MLPRQVGEPRPEFDEWSRSDPTKVAFSALAWPTVEEAAATFEASTRHGTEAQLRGGLARYYGLGVLFRRGAA